MATQVGEAIVKLRFDGSGAKGDLEKTGKGLTKWGIAKANALGDLMSSAVKKLANTISSHMDAAIGRLDTLNNFPKVMQALGYSAEESESSIQKLSDGLDGLPTTLDDMANGVQMLSATMGNLDQGMVNATSVGLSLNNMFLASGKGTQEASMALENYNKMLATGKVDLQHWQSLVISAPGQMDQLAKSMLGANANQQDLYKAMQAGTVTFDELNAKIVELNEQGGENFASFADQAVAATGGIATQLQNISTTVTKIITAAMENNTKAVDKGIKQLVSRVNAVAPTLVKGLSGAFGAIIQALPEMIKDLLPVIMEGVNDLGMAIINSIPSFVNLLVDSIPLVVDGLMQLLDALIKAFPTIIPQLIQAVTNLVITLAQQLARPDFLSMILNAGLTLLLEIVKALPQMIVSLIEALPTIISNIVSFLLDPNNLAKIIDAAVKLFLGIVMAVPQILGALLNAFKNLVGNLWNGITSMFGEFAHNFGNFIGGIFRNAINGVLTFIENFINGPIDIINGFIGAINDAFGFIGVNLGRIDRIRLPRLAMGGIVTNTTIAMIGESGDEAVLPLDNNTEWAGTLAALITDEMDEQDELENRPINVTLNNNINNRLDAQEIGQVMMQSIRRAA